MAEPDLVDVEAHQTVVVATVTTWDAFPHVWKSALDQVHAAFEAAGVRPGRNVMVYLDNRPSVEVGVLVDQQCPAVRPPLVRSHLPAGRAAHLTHDGGYAGLPAAYSRLDAFCRTQEVPEGGPSWEIYGHVTGPEDPTIDLYRLHPGTVATASEPGG